MRCKFGMISVVIPSFNRKDNVLALLADLTRQEGVEFEVIVVDDCSPDGTFEAVSRDFPQVRQIKNPKNSGPAVTRNRGVLAAKGEIIVGFDSDVTVPDTRVLAKVIETFNRYPKVDGLAFRLFSPDGASDDKPRWWHPVAIESHAASTFETSYFSGTAYAFRREPMLRAGLYPEWLYMHYEEVLLAYRMIDQGSVILYVPRLTAVHHARPTPRRNKIKTFYKPRNQILLAVACYTTWRGAIYLAPRLGLSAFQALLGGHFGEFLAAIKSARELARPLRSQRKPLAKKTWMYLATLGRGVQPETVS